MITAAVVINFSLILSLIRADTATWATSDIEVANTSLGLRQRSGSVSAPSWNVTPNPGPLVRGSPSF